MNENDPYTRQFAKTSDGQMIAWREYGRGERVVVLAHGLAANGEQFHEDAVHLAGHGYKIIVPDVRGHGFSKVANARAVDFSLPRLAADMRHLLAEVGARKVAWVGNSLGGILALQMLRDGETRLASLVLFGTAFRLDLPALAESIIPALYRFPGAFLTGKVAAHTTTGSKSGRRVIDDMVAAFDPEAGRAVATAVRSYDFRREALAYHHPMLVIRGGKDMAVNLALDRDLGLFSASTFTKVEMRNAGHCANLDDPAFFRDTLQRFWAFSS